MLPTDSAPEFWCAQGKMTIILSGETGYRNPVAHLSESALEEYALGRLTKYRAERVEEHVASCSECRERLETEIGIVRMMKAAARITATMSGRKGKV